MLFKLRFRLNFRLLKLKFNLLNLIFCLQFDLFKPAPAETTRDFYAELPIAIKVTGSYHDMGAFASDIGQLSRIVTLNDLSLAASPKDNSLVMDATAKTFRYLDDEEVAKQRKSAAPKAAAKK